MAGWRVLAAVSVAAVMALAPGPPASAADTISQLQWFLHAVKAQQAQRVTKGDGVIVAVIDSGVDAGHPDLAGAILSGTAFAGSSSKAGRTDPVGHGTRMAGIIAARGGGGNHALGIAPRAKILPVAIDVDSTTSLAQPIRWAVDHGAKVINLSISRPAADGTPADEAAAIAYAQTKDTVVVASAGNVDQAGAAVGSPANLPGVLAVSGTTRSGGFWDGSAHGPQVGLAAPAQDIVTVGARNRHDSGYSTGGATSEASAIVSGVAALVRAKYPKLNAANVVNRLLRTATDEGDQGRDEFYGYGLADAERAVTADVSAVKTNPLGAQAAGSPSAGAGAEDRASADSGPLGSPGARLALVLGIAAVGLLGSVLVIVLIVLAVNRRTARRLPPPGYPQPPRPGHGPPQGYQQPPGHRPAPGGYPPNAPSGRPAAGPSWPSTDSPGRPPPDGR